MRLLFGIILIVFLIQLLQISCLNLYVPAWVGPSPDVTTPIMVQHAIHMMRSYKNLLGKDLITTNSVDDKDIARELFEADRFILEIISRLCKKTSVIFQSSSGRIVLSHGIQNGINGPVLNYGNKVTTLKLLRIATLLYSSNYK